jgi:hypothetical protein
MAKIHKTQLETPLKKLEPLTPFDKDITTVY